ncbi:50S ribosomal protein L23 [Candidatus Falkowbacteria bacterium]|nr:50S ribosomal protein L23 [Candidatus Falkowbacteria bacterium]
MAALLKKIFSKKEADEKKPDINVETKAVVEKVKKDIVRKKLDKKKDLNAFKILLRPLITEKATDVGALNKYEFLVSKQATRSEIAEMVEKIYGVCPAKVNIVRSIGKKVRHGRKFGATKAKKKAIVTLSAGDKIEIYEGV